MIENPTGASPTAELRDRLLSDTERWGSQLPDDDAFVGTLGYGMAVKGLRSIEVLLRRAVAAFAPGTELPDRPTFGLYVSVLESLGSRARTTCSAGSRPLMPKGELDVLKRLSRMRAAAAHVQDGIVSPADLQDMTAGTIREYLTLFGSVVEMQFVDELICRERSSPAAHEEA